MFVSTRPKRPSIQLILKPLKGVCHNYTKIFHGIVSPFLVAGHNESRDECGGKGAFRDREKRAGQGADRGVKRAISRVTARRGAICQSHKARLPSRETQLAYPKLIRLF